MRFIKVCGLVNIKIIIKSGNDVPETDFCVVNRSHYARVGVGQRGFVSVPNGRIQLGSFS